MGILIRTNEPLAIGTRLRLRFQVDDARSRSCSTVRSPGSIRFAQRREHNPGMGVRFIELTPDRREQVVALVRTVAYLRETRAISAGEA